MNKFICRILGIILIGSLAVSCNKNESGDKDVITEQSFAGCFSSVSDFSTQGQTLYTGTGYQLRINYTRLTGDLLVSGLKLTSSLQFPDFTIKDIPFKAMNDGWFEFAGTNIVPEIPGFAHVPTFNSVRIRLLQRDIDNHYLPAVLIRFEIDGHYVVVSSFEEQVLFGKTESTPIDGNTFTTGETSYLLKLNPAKRTADIVMVGSKFAENMPSFDITLPDVPFAVAGNKIVFSTAALTPSIGGTPYPSFPITNLEGELDLSEGLEMEFNCAPAILPGQLFNVDVDCKYTDSTDKL